MFQIIYATLDVSPTECQHPQKVRDEVQSSQEKCGEQTFLTKK
jgi:hypothetical protein